MRVRNSEHLWYSRQPHEILRHPANLLPDREGKVATIAGAAEHEEI
ncbi:MAG TPA: hypothetical protein VGG04_17495 [Candidatus Sulfotelmatobacter sp.]|jgi:hypothetical protein